jgi:stage V sporulation protein D (sporulation-specific penicillin-binding protein)
MSQSQYQLIASKVDKNTSELVKEFIKKQAVAGIYIQQDSKRYYPFGSLAAHAIGFTGDDTKDYLVWNWL